MTAVQAIYDGRVFIPEKPCNITSGSKVTLNIETAIGNISEKQRNLTVPAIKDAYGIFKGIDTHFERDEDDRV